MKFFLKRRQRFADLQSSPPKDLPHLRSLIKAEIISLGGSVAALETEFYGGKTALTFTRRLGAPITEALEAHRLSELSSLRQLETVIRFARDPEMVAAAAKASNQPNHVSKEAAETLLTLQNRVLEFVPGRFSDLIHRVQTLLTLCERYLRAFYEVSVDAKVETAKLYASNITVWADRVRHCVTHLFQLPQFFLRGGLSLARLSPPVLDLLERCELLPCPIAGIFPECCERLREAGRLLSEWVQQDELYSLYLKNDLIDMEKARTAREKNLKTVRHRSSMRQFRVKQLQSEKARLGVELETLIEKDAELLVDDEALYQDLNSLQVDIEIKEFRRDELKRTAPSMNKDEVHNMWEELTEGLRRLRMRLPVLRRQQAAVRLKMSWIESKRVEYKHVCDQLNAVEDETWKDRRLCSDEQTELEKIIASIEKCKEIQRLKSSPDVLKKIFYNMPLPTEEGQRRGSQTTYDKRDYHGLNITPTRPHPVSEHGPHRGNANNFERVLKIVSARVGRDWHRLYRALPFVPSRGDETVDADIQLIENEYVGEALHERAKRALIRWRRFHTRARVEDLCSAVNAIHRQDLVDAIDAILHPVDPAAKEEEPIPDFLSKDLIPYYREVERFDRLRAAHRI